MGIRGVAMAIDSAVWLLAFMVGVTAVGAATGDLQVTETGLDTDLEGTAALFGFIAWFALALGYHVVGEWRYGATLGKYLVGIRVRGQDAEPITLRAAVIRNLFRLIDWIPMFYLVGILAIFVSDGEERLGDRVADTAVFRL